MKKKKMRRVGNLYPGAPYALNAKGEAYLATNWHLKRGLVRGIVAGFIKNQKQLEQP